MNVKRYFWTVACTVLFICSSAATAQEVGKKMPDRQERGFKPMPLSPEKSARHATDRMNSLLNLTEKQYDKLYKLNLKWAREDQKNNSTVPPMNNKPEGMPNFRGSRGFGQRPHGNRPPEDIERRPPRDFASSNDKEKIEKQRKKREKKLKKVQPAGEHRNPAGAGRGSTEEVKAGQGGNQHAEDEERSGERHHSHSGRGEFSFGRQQGQEAGSGE